MMITEQRPVMTLAILSYNQEDFVLMAVEGALTQTYSPLQIILSDDASTDRTYDLMVDCVKNYNGPHKIKLNRNHVNLGIGGHVNRIFELAEGDLVVLAAGDDISLPQRVEKVATRWASEGYPVCAIYSSVYRIDKSGNKLSLISVSNTSCFTWSLFMSSEPPMEVGCSECLHRALFDDFGPLVPNLVNEDIAMRFRAALLGKLIYIEEPLVLYRLHDRNISTSAIYNNGGIGHFIELMKVGRCRGISLFDNYLADLSVIRHRGSIYSAGLLDAIEKSITQRKILSELALVVMESRGMAKYKAAYHFLKASLNTEQWKWLPKMMWPKSMLYLLNIKHRR